MGTMFEVPHLQFSTWKSWKSRPRPSSELDVPSEFGILGIYLLSSWYEGPPTKPPEPKDLPAEMVYVGMSRHIDQRLEQRHSAVVRYRVECSDIACQRLYFATWRSDWSSRSISSMSPTARARLLLYERALIVLYAEKHGRLPRFNRH